MTPYKNKADKATAMRKYRKLCVYSVKQIKTAFWKQFHKSGEQWFNYLGTEEENNESMENAWTEFLDSLKESKEAKTE